MSTELSTAFSLLATGMITVFVVLLLVVVTGKLLIRMVNALTPVPALEEPDQIDKKKVAAITAAVEAFTQGTGKVTKIERKQ